MPLLTVQRTEHGERDRRDRLRTRVRKPSLRSTRSRRRLDFEWLDDRTLLSTLTVSSDLDSGPGTLRQAILDAQDGDTINFDPRLGGRAIALTGGELVIDKDLEIVGLGSNVLALDGGGSNRIFHVTSPEADVTIRDLAVINGSADRGGGLLNEGGDVTLVGALFLGNQAAGTIPGASSYGGAVASLGAGGSLTVRDSEFAFNQAVGARGADGGEAVSNGAGGDAYGGSIYADAGTVIVIDGSVFANDRAVAGDGGDGGVGFDNGVAGVAGGGGIAVLGDVDPVSVTITDTRIVGGVAQGGRGGSGGLGQVNGFGGSSFGGALIVRASGGAVVITGSEFVRNQAVGGAGGQAGPLGANGLGGGAAGGAVYNTGAGLSIAGSSFTRNEALAGAGGAIVDGSINVQNFGGGASGGAVMSASGALTVSDSAFDRNRAVGGAGGAGGTGTWGGLGGSGFGGGIAASNGIVTVSASQFTRNEAVGGAGGAGGLGGDGRIGGVAKGGGLQFAGSASDLLSITGSSFTANAATGGAGGAGGAGGDGGRGGDGSGGGIDYSGTDDAPFTFADGVLTSNAATGGVGGDGGRGGDGGDGGDGSGGGFGLFGAGGLVGRAEVSGASIIGNIAEGAEAGFGGYGGNGGNGGNGRGGGLFADVSDGPPAGFPDVVDQGATVRLTNSTVRGNAALLGFEGGYDQIGQPGEIRGQGVGGGVFLGRSGSSIDEATLTQIAENLANTRDPDVSGEYDT